MEFRYWAGIAAQCVEKSLADVTIGLAVFNGASTIAAALESLLDQTYRDFKLLISDNGSTDATQSICEKYAAMDARIHYQRYEKTVAVSENYHRVLLTAETPFFMWAAADDLWAPGFIATHRAVLINQPEIVGSQSRVIFVSDGNPTRMATGTYPLTGSHAANLAQFLADPADNSRFYAVFRTKVLQQSFPTPSDFNAFDWNITAATLQFGGHNEISDILMVRDETYAARYATAAKRRGGISRIIPLLDFSRYLLSDATTPRTPAVLARLAWLNVRIALRFVSYSVAAAATRRSNNSNPNSLGQAIAKSVAHSLDVGLTERMQSATGAVLKRVAPQSAAVSQVKPKTSGWQMPVRTPNTSPAADTAVILICHNQLAEVLAWLDQRTSAPDTQEIVIVDNGSTDATALVLRANPHVKFVRLADRVPSSLALEAGVAATSATPTIVIDKTTSTQA
jgi:glycosyltransferase involved in cell wall biosynthesis